jgi:hypothetical protein
MRGLLQLLSAYLLDINVRYKKELEKTLKIGRVIAIIELCKSTFTNGE